jgi:hypothetical protein
LAFTGEVAGAVGAVPAGLVIIAGLEAGAVGVLSGGLLSADLQPAVIKKNPIMMT